MPVTRQFLGWEQPVAESIRRYLIPELPPSCVELGDVLVVVPTRQAGRRLRETLARYCEQAGTAVLSLRVVPPAFLLMEPGEDEPPEASPALLQAVWARVLRSVDPDSLQGVFPAVAEGGRDFNWCLQTGTMLQRLRRELIEGGLTIGAVLAAHGDALEEPERWRHLAVLEQAYLEAMQSFGYADPYVLQARRAQSPVLPEGVRRLIVAATPDPPQLVLQAVEALGRSLEVDILICAPPELADQFDAWGRPGESFWGTCGIAIPGGAAALHPAAGPQAQADLALQLMARRATRFAPADVVIGAPDEDVTRYLIRALREQGLAASDPAERPLGDTRLFRLIRSFILWVSEGSYQALRRFIRHPDVLAGLASPDLVLRDLDELQNQHLPMDMADVKRALAQAPERWPALRRALPLLEQWCRPELDGPARVRQMLRGVYAKRLLHASDETDRRFRDAAEVTAETLDAFGSDLAGLKLSDDELLALLVQQLAARPCGSREEDPGVDIEGWLELAWSDAPYLILTGMNEGRVPGGRLSDVFLPDSLRVRLKLRSDAGRLARDAYWLSAMIASRREKGEVSIICGRTGAGGDPLKPSRLLFRCGDEELAARCERLFSAVSEPRGSSASSISFKLKPPPLDSVASPERMSVTAFRGYLNCPFRFFLQHSLRMEPLSDDKREPDALDFGILLHAALEHAAQDRALWHGTDAGPLGGLMTAYAENWMRERYGARLPLHLRMILDGALQRLRRFAQVQVADAAAGWELLYGERKMELRLCGVTISGKLDRIDRHRETGCVRIVDYKSSEQSVAPEAAHLASDTAGTAGLAVAPPGARGRTRRWIDLQLPLYVRMARAQPEFAGAGIQAAYANLPKALDETGLSVWDTLNDDLLDSALSCAEGVVAAIQQRRFWPPSERVTYDPFEALFFGLPAAQLTEAPDA